MNKLQQIQSELKAPKGQTNSFGKYKYRSCEDILEAIKPLLKEHSMSLVISDKIIEVGGRVYVEATAQLHSDTGALAGISAASAREPETKKGMDEAQITGATSSYARKYALNGLFAIDDTKDPDATNNHGTPKKPAMQPAEAIKLLKSAKTLDTLGKCWQALTIDIQQSAEVINTKNELKSSFTNK